MRWLRRHLGRNGKFYACGRSNVVPVLSDCSKVCYLRYRILTLDDLHRRNAATVKAINFGKERLESEEHDITDRCGLYIRSKDMDEWTARDIERLTLKRFGRIRQGVGSSTSEFRLFKRVHLAGQFRASIAATSETPASTWNAIDIARNAEGELDPHVRNYLEEALSNIWNRVQAEPDTYLLSKGEFAIFNFFIQRFDGSDVAEKVVARYWQHTPLSSDSGVRFQRI